MRIASVGTQNAFKHGQIKSDSYRSWRAMKRRCLDVRHPFYKNYGAKGITVCERWMDFRNFYEDMGDRPEGTTLDRLDNKMGYYKANCRWATKKQQIANRSNSKYFLIDGEKKTMTEWANVYKVNPRLIHSRVTRLGWDIKRALTEPLKEDSNA